MLAACKPKLYPPPIELGDILASLYLFKYLVLPFVLRKKSFNVDKIALDSSQFWY